MGFKDIMNDDLNNVFFSTEEFASTHTIDNVSMDLIIDEDGLEEFKNRLDSDYDGIYKSILMFYVKKADIGFKPAIHAIINLDDKSYRVLNVTEDTNMLRIICGWDED